MFSRSNDPYNTDDSGKGMMYAILAVALFVAISIPFTSRKGGAGIESELTKVESRDVSQTRDVRGGEAPETFYLIHGERAYTHLDGEAIDSYDGRQD